jgi:small subunit ribosomal protein S8
MVMTDPVADMLTRIRNANMAYKDEIVLPSSTLKERIAEILLREGYVNGVDVQGEGKDRRMTIRLRYGPNRQRTISGIERVSKPGKRVYAGRDEIPRVLGGLGLVILSTSEGVMSGRQALKAGLGGEVLCYVW